MKKLLAVALVAVVLIALYIFVIDTGAVALRPDGTVHWFGRTACPVLTEVWGCWTAP